MKLLVTLWGTALTAGGIFLWPPKQSLMNGTEFPSVEQFPLSAGGAILLNLFLLWTIFLYFRGDNPNRHKIWNNFSQAFLGTSFFSLSGTYIAHLATLPTPPDTGAALQINGKWVFLTLAATWLSDTGGYFFGKTFKGPKLFPAISPGKTWSGLAGCVVGATAGAFGAKFLLLPSLSASDCLTLGPIVAVIGQTGDLAESLFKRSHGVKDSGSILPGHGGLYDRIDALLWTAPIIYYYISWFLIK